MSNEIKRTISHKIALEILEFSILFLGIFLIYLTSLYNYILFHTIAELFSIIIAGGVFFVGWNSRKYMKSSFFLILGTSSLFIGILDLVHILAYPGMQIFADSDTNLAASLWIAARYLQAGSLLIASFLIKKSIKTEYLFTIYFSLTTILIIIIFNNLFPVCFIDGAGLTPFKKISEYIIDFILLASLIIIIKKRAEFDKKVFFLIISSIITTMMSELAFTFYLEAYGFPNLIGHIFKIIAFYFLYKAIIQIGIEKPFDLLFRKVKRSELELKNIINHSNAIIMMLDENGYFTLVNEKAASLLGGNPENFIGKSIKHVFPKDLGEEYLNSTLELIKTGINRSYQRTFDLPTGQKTYWITEQPIKDVDGKNSSLLSVATDISEKIKSDKLIQEAEERYHTIFEQSPDGILVIDFETLRAVEFNDVACKILGYTHEEFEKLQVNDYYVMETPSETRHHFEKVLRDGSDDFESKFRTKSGEIKDIYIRAKLISLSGKNYFQSIFRDITEQKKIAELKTRLASIVESSEDAIIGKTLDGIIISWNKAAEKIYYYSAEEMLGKSIKILSPPNHGSEIFEILTRIKSGEKLEGFETERIRKDGSKVNVSLTVSAIKDANNKIIGASTIARDITEKKKAEEEIRRLSKFPSENPNPVLRVNNEKVIYINKIGESLFNISNGSPNPKALEDSVKDAFTNKKIQELEIKLDNRVYTLVLTPIENENYVNIYGMDITERKKAEERLSQLISTVSHELRTPITVLLMSMEYLTKHKNSLEEDLEAKLMDGISRNIHLLNELAEDILLISRMDENRLELEWKEYKPKEIIKEILYLMEPIGKEKKISFEVDVDENIHLRGDSKRIDQVFRIIIDNTIKYSRENSKVEIRAINNYKGKYNLNENSGVLFEFKDYGRGIPKYDLPKIFERFFRSSNVNEISGTGLGLAIAKDLIEAHKGNIYVESELEKGTTFYLYLPKIE